MKSPAKDQTNKLPKSSLIASSSKAFALLRGASGAFLFLLLASSAYAYTPENLADAIYKAEGGIKATYAYGIRSVKYQSLEEARQICLRTIRNHMNRHREHNCRLEFLECLSQRYAPTKGATNDPKGLNRNWLSNIRYFLRKGETK